MNQEDAAKKAGLGTRQRWSDVESGKRANIKLATLDRIAKALGMKGKDLLK